MELSCFPLALPRFTRNKKQPSSPLAGPIAEAFREYINNEIPAWFIDTSELRLVPRKEVFHVFQVEIANVTEEQIKERIEGSQSNPLATYQPRREGILRQIIQEIVKYNVLSHRRNNIASDPSFRDIHGKRGVLRSEKLVEFCKTSKKLGCKLAWIDSCCINETDAVERSEAINAMYKWYANSYLCIVYLAESTSFAEWARESWFEQGWTLRELLAPKRLKFYNKHWQPLVLLEIEDDRKYDRIAFRLEEITGISRAVLRADNSQGTQEYTFWEVMSWASKRQTTRIEDDAYALVGFFPVSLTIANGEGKRAFLSLVEAVAAKAPSWDIFAWRGRPSPEHFALPLSPSSYPSFEADMWKDRVGVRDFTITTNGLSLKSLPPIPMEVCRVASPDGTEKLFLVNLKPRLGKGTSLGKYGDLVVECETTRIGTISGARQLSACILNHHGARSRDKGKLMVGKEYICFLLYSDDEENEDTDEMTWMKIATNNQLRIACVGLPETVIQEQGAAEPNTFDLSLTTTKLMQSPRASTQ